MLEQIDKTRPIVGVFVELQIRKLACQFRFVVAQIKLRGDNFVAFLNA